MQVGFGSIILLVAVFSVFVLMRLREIRTGVETAQSIQRRVEVAKDLQLQIANVWQFITDASLTKDRKVIEEEAGQALSSAYADIDKLKALGAHSAQKTGELDALRDSVASLYSTGVRMFDAYPRRWEDGNVVVDECDRACDRANRAAAGYVVSTTREANEDAARMQQTTRSAVVADEVRKLAERTTRATKEIGTMIKKIQDDTAEAVKAMNEGTREVASGIQLADQAGNALQQIIENTLKVTDMVAQIASASEEQSSTSEEIARNVESISGVAQETASGTHEIAKASEDLNSQTESLQRLMSRSELAPTKTR